MRKVVCVMLVLLGLYIGADAVGRVTDISDVVCALLPHAAAAGVVAAKIVCLGVWLLMLLLVILVLSSCCFDEAVSSCFRYLTIYNLFKHINPTCSTIK